MTYSASCRPVLIKRNSLCNINEFLVLKVKAQQIQRNIKVNWCSLECNGRNYIENFVFTGVANIKYTYFTSISSFHFVKVSVSADFS